MKVYLSDVDVTLRLKEEAPVPTWQDIAHKDFEDFRAQLFKTWKRWAHHYGIEWSPTPIDYKVAKRLILKYGAMEDQVEDFWLLASAPLIRGEYGHHFILFANFLKHPNA